MSIFKMLKNYLHSQVSLNAYIKIVIHSQKLLYKTEEIYQHFHSSRNSNEQHLPS